MENYTLEQLVQYCTENSIQLASTLSKNLVLAYIYRALHERNGYPIQVVPEDPHALNVAIETGVNPELPSEVYKAFADSIGAPYDYIQKPGLTAVVFPIYQKTAKINDTLYYKTLQRNLYAMCSKNFVYVAFRKPYNYPVFRDDTVIDFILTNLNPIPRSEDESDKVFRARCVLHYQTEDDLKYIASIMPEKMPYFETKPGSMEHIIRQLNDTLADTIISMCTQKYLTPDRVPIYQDESIHTEIPSPLPFPYCFAIPANKFEQAWYNDRRVSKADYPFTPYYRVGVKYGLKTYSAADLVADNLVDPEYIPRPKMIDEATDTVVLKPNPTEYDIRHAVMFLVRYELRELRYISFRNIMISMGYDGIPYPARPGLTHHIDMITRGYDPNDPEKGKHFDLVTSAAYCANEANTLLEPFAEYVATENKWLFTFGAYSQVPTCFTLEELMAVFKYDEQTKSIPSYTVFRNPIPGQPDFTPSQINELINLGTLYYEVHPDTKDFFLALELANEVGSNVLFRELQNSPEKNKFIEIFQYMFEAGMYQRAWQGPGHPYPMEFEKTKVPGYEYEIHMSPPLYKAQLVIGSLSPEDKKLFDQLPVYQYSNKHLITANYNIAERFEKVCTQKGEQECTAIASGYFIPTAYFYLKLLGVNIPDFDITNFNPQTQHRD